MQWGFLLRIAVLVALALIFCDAHASSEYEYQHHQFMHDDHNSLVESSTAVKHRQKRGWWLLGAAVAAVACAILCGGDGGGGGGGGGDNGAEQRHNEEMDQMKRNFCYDNCVTEWSPWGACSAECGGGTMTRTRSPANEGYCRGIPCSHNMTQTAQCNTWCQYGATSTGDGTCICPPGRKGQCCHTQTRCSLPKRPENGDREGGGPFYYGHYVSYTCNEGFSLVGPRDIECNAIEKWSDDPPKCEALTCHSPPEPEHGKIYGNENNKTEFEYGEVIMYSCNAGYELMGPQTRQCSSRNGNEAWTGFNSICTETSCEPPVWPKNGEIYGSDFTYEGTIHYSCNKGFKLQGFKQSTCRQNRRWNPPAPTCDPIYCDPPIVPEKGKLLPAKQRYYFDEAVDFACEDGFLLDGNQRLRCQADEDRVCVWGGCGKWSGEPPSCKAVECGDPGTPLNGAKDGSIFFYPHSVKFICFAGHTLQGNSEIDCTVEGTWSSAPPTCSPCPHNTYKTSGGSNSDCIPCPPNTHTVTKASTSLAQCICNEGYKLDSNGKCQEVRCPTLTAFEHGILEECENKMGSVCKMSCVDGYILSSGSGTRQCLEDGRWSGRDPVCQACGTNTFKKEGTNSCFPCPSHSHTTDVGQSLEGCICDDGFTGNPGGPCTDINECLANGGKGDCQDECENTDGGYWCLCNTPGYENDPLNPNACIQTESCRNLTEADAPDNGGLVCHWFREQNSQFCSVRCNEGYEFPTTGVNSYETCGSTTDFSWSFEIRGEELIDCQEEFFPGIKLEAETFYFVDKCKDLTPKQQDEAKQVFANILNENGVCQKSSTQLCDMDNFAIICGKETFRRRKRSADGSEQEEEVSQATLQLDVKARKTLDVSKDALRICAMFRYPSNRCTKRMAGSLYSRYLKAALLYSEKQLKNLFTHPQDVSFQAADREFEAKKDGVSTGVPEPDCDEGMATVNGMCVACQPGYYLAGTACVPCPVGFFQPLAKQTMCIPCPKGTMAFNKGSTSCEMCPPGKWGVQCKKTCGPCEHGTCDPKSGKCVCSSGWEGEACDTDIMGCSEDTCFPGVSCYDVIAPGTGFVCGDCPEGMSGDGQSCEMPLPNYRR